LVHSALTRSIYGYPQISLPVDPYNRHEFPRDFYEKLALAVRSPAFSGAKIKSWIAAYPETFVLLYKAIPRHHQILFSAGFRHLRAHTRSQTLANMLKKPDGRHTILQDSVNVATNTYKFNWIAPVPRTLAEVLAK